MEGVPGRLLQEGIDLEVGPGHLHFEGVVQSLLLHEGIFQGQDRLLDRLLEGDSQDPLLEGDSQDPLLAIDSDLDLGPGDYFNERN
jgi:hypothetical protein